MNKTIVCSVLSFVLGAGAGVFASWKYFQKKSDNEVEEIKEWYQNKIDDLSEIADAAFLDRYVDYDISEEGEEVNPETPDPNMEEIQAKLQKNHEITTNYAEMYRQKAMNDPDIEEDGEGEADDQNDEYENSESERWNEEHARNRGRAPRIISYEEAGNLAAYIGNETLYYYAYSDSVVTENEEEIDEPGLLLGDCLEKYDFIHSDERIIFVMNYDTDTCYEVQKIMGEWDG